MAHLGRYAYESMLTIVILFAQYTFTVTDTGDMLIMTSKERVQKALHREPVDRVPVFMWFQPSTAQRLAHTLDIPPARLAEALGDDVRQTWVSNNYAMEGIVHEQEGEAHTDDWGITWRKEGEFNQIVNSPLATADREACLAYEHPWNRVDALLALMAPVVAQSERYYIGCDVSPCVFEMYARIRGLEAAALDLAMCRLRCGVVGKGILPVSARLALAGRRRGGTAGVDDESGYVA